MVDLFLPRPEPDRDGRIFTHYSHERAESLLSPRVAARAGIRPSLAVAQLVYNLLVAVKLEEQYGRPCGIATSLSAADYSKQQSNRKGSEYVPYEEMRAALDGLVGASVVDIQAGRRGRRTRLFVGPEFRRLLTRAGAGGVAVTEPPRGRLLLRKWACVEHTRDVWKKQYVDFVPGEEQERMVAALEYINRNNRAHLFEYVPLGSGPPVRIEQCAVEFNRIFNEGRWDRGGRFTALVHSLRREERATLRVDHRPIVELDYSGLHPTMLYHMIGRPLERKAYDVPGIGMENRGAAKLALLIAFNAASEAAACRALEHELDTHDVPLVGLAPRELLRRLRAAHTPIRRFFFSGVGPELQYYDSVIAETVMFRFAEEGIPCIGIHDSFVVPAPHEWRLREEMARAYRAVMDVDWVPQIDRK